MSSVGDLDWFIPFPFLFKTAAKCLGSLLGFFPAWSNYEIEAHLNKIQGVYNSWKSWKSTGI